MSVKAGQAHTSRRAVSDVSQGPEASATDLTCDVAHVADVPHTPGTNGNGWRYDQPLTPCAACGTGTTNRAPSGRPLHLACPEAGPD
jgi:hypothetical protein